MANYIYNGKFAGNVLILGWTECGKTTFIQNLGINNFFGALKKVESVSGIELDVVREAQIQSCFSCNVDFYNPEDKHSFEDLLEHFKSRPITAKLNETDSTELNLYKSSFGEEKKKWRRLWSSWFIKKTFKFFTSCKKI